jgi:hypothetical protein
MHPEVIFMVFIIFGPLESVHLRLSLNVSSFQPVAHKYSSLLLRLNNMNVTVGTCHMFLQVC